MASKKTERLWWAVLVRAEEQATTELTRQPPDMDAWMLVHRVNLRARGELIKLGLNLDNVFPPADDEFLRLLRMEREAEETRKQEMAKAKAFVKKFDTLIAKLEAPCPSSPNRPRKKSKPR
jgi:hypothetical protein